MKTYIELGPTPANEQHAEDNGEQARKECRTYIRQLRRIFGNERGGAKFSILITGLSNTYIVIIKYDTTSVAATAYISRVLWNLPTNWDATAREELGL